MTIKEKKAEICRETDAVYIVKNGDVTMVTPKQFGQDTIIWKNGQVLDIDRSERHRVNGQAVI